MTAQAPQNQPSVPFQPSSTAPDHTLSIPVGSSSATTSIGQTHPSASTSSLSRPRGRPGCTRYQWPSSMASVTAPRKAAPTSVRSERHGADAPSAASSAAATSPTAPISGRHEVEQRRELARRRRGAVARAPDARVDAGHRRDTRRAPVVLGSLPATPRPGGGRRTRPARAGSRAPTPSDAASRTGTTPNASPAANAPAAISR